MLLLLPRTLFAVLAWKKRRVFCSLSFLLCITALVPLRFDNNADDDGNEDVVDDENRERRGVEKGRVEGRRLLVVVVALWWFPSENAGRSHQPLLLFLWCRRPAEQGTGTAAAVAMTIGAQEHQVLAAAATTGTDDAVAAILVILVAASIIYSAKSTIVIVLSFLLPASGR